MNQISDQCDCGLHIDCHLNGCACRCHRFSEMLDIEIALGCWNREHANVRALPKVVDYQRATGETNHDALVSFADGSTYWVSSDGSARRAN